MNKHLRYVIPTVVVASIAATTIVFVRAGDDATKSAGGGPSPCKLEMTRALYGFQCLGSAFTGTKLEPVSFVGTVRGDGKGFFEGFGTFNSSNGSASTHVAGNGTLLPGCFGHVDYTTNEIVVPGGGRAGRNYRRCGAAFSVPSGAGEVKLQRIVEADPGRRATGSGSQPNPIDSGLLPPQRRTPIVIQESGCGSPRELSPSIVSW